METPLPQLQLERMPDGKLKLSWQGIGARRMAEIYWSPAPDPFRAGEHKLTGAAGDAASFIFNDPNPGKRSYYRLKFEDGIAGTTAERRLPLEGLANFRDLGGYATKDGRTVKWGLLFRSEQLSNLTEADYRYLHECGIKLICDYRAENEANMVSYPEFASARRVRIPIAVTASVEPCDRLILSNKNYVANHTGDFARMLELLLHEDCLPAVQHCVAGKDRTGFGSALVLLALGVPEQTVMEDYLLTNQFLDKLYNGLLNSSALSSGSIYDTDKLPAELEARPEYLQAAFDEIQSRYGSTECYLERGLGLTGTKRNQLQRLLLTDD